MRLDAGKLDELRNWAQALRGTGDEASAASGRAILLLIEELERLDLELRRTRERLDSLDPESNAKADARPGETVASALHARLPSADRDSDQPVAPQPEPTGDPDPNIAPGGDTASARSWIETLRRQK